MKGDVIYVVRFIRKKERDFIINQIKKLKTRILWQQFEDGFLTYRHYGIDCGDGTAIHFRGTFYIIQNSAWIQHTSIQRFLGGGKLEVEKDIEFKFPREVVVQRALRQVGTDFGGYKFLFNNCEHFAYWCATGKRISKQVLLRNEE